MLLTIQQLSIKDSSIQLLKPLPFDSVNKIMIDVMLEPIGSIVQSFKESLNYIVNHTEQEKAIISGSGASGIGKTAVAYAAGMKFISCIIIRIAEQNSYSIQNEIDFTLPWQSLMNVINDIYLQLQLLNYNQKSMIEIASYYIEILILSY